MTIFMNNKALECPAPATVEQALTASAIHDQRGIAVAVNNSVVPKSEWNKFTLKENDKLIVIKATQGG